MTIFIATIKPTALDDTTKRLVDARRKSSAFKHVAQDTIEVREATPQEIHPCAKDGIDIETAADQEDAHV